MSNASWRTEVSLIEKHPEHNGPWAEETTCPGDPVAVPAGSQNISEVSQRECPNCKGFMIQVHLFSRRTLQQILHQFLQTHLCRDDPIRRGWVQARSPCSWFYAWLCTQALRYQGLHPRLQECSKSPCTTISATLLGLSQRMPAAPQSWIGWRSFKIKTF